MTFSEEIVSSIVYALSAEAVTWPKPGLVTAVSNGCHRDMDVYSFLHSAAVLAPSLHEAGELAYKADDPDEGERLFSQLRIIGIEAERRMLAATGGVNTHRGAIFFGILLAAAAAQVERDTRCLDPISVCASATRIAGPWLRADLARVRHGSASRMSKGMYAYRALGITGARGEVIGGFQSVLTAGLPAFQQAGRLEVGTRLALVHTLISLMTVVEDSTVLNRERRLERLFRAQGMAREAIAAGSVFTSEGRRLIGRMARYFNEAQISPGGAADLTAVAHYLSIWRELRPVGEAVEDQRECTTL